MEAQKPVVTTAQANVDKAQVEANTAVANQQVAQEKEQTAKATVDNMETSVAEHTELDKQANVYDREAGKKRY